LNLIIKKQIAYGGKMEFEPLTLEEFLESLSTARIQVGTRYMSYIDNEHIYIIYDIRAPHKIIIKTPEFRLAWEELISE
jgi:hypothetical protein